MSTRGTKENKTNRNGAGRAPNGSASAIKRPTSITDGAPSLKKLEPAAARWIAALIRISGQHPAMTRILDVIERLQDRPVRTNFLLLGEPGTGKDGLARALHHLIAPQGPLVRLDVAGYPEEEALRLLCGSGRSPGLAEQAQGGTLVIEEAIGLSPRVQVAVLRLLKAGRVCRVGTQHDVDVRIQLKAIALSDGDLSAEVAAGRFRHDLYHRLARVVLWLPPLRERKADLGPSAIWMGNRILAGAAVPLELRTSEDMQRATPDERRRSIELLDAAVHALGEHAWPGNFRELEAAMERALLLYREGAQVTAEDVRAALASPVLSPS